MNSSNNSKRKQN